MINYQAQQQNADVNAQAVALRNVVAGWQSVMHIATGAHEGMPVMATPSVEINTTCAPLASSALAAKPALKPGKSASKPLATLGNEPFGAEPFGAEPFGDFTLGCEVISPCVAATRIHKAGHTGQRGFTGTLTYTG